MVAPALFAFAEDEFNIAAPFRDWLDLELIILVVSLILLISIGIYVTVRMRSAARPGGDEVPEHTLEQYQEMLDQGIIDAKEYERIASLVNKQPPTPPPAKP